MQNATMLDLMKDVSMAVAIAPAGSGVPSKAINQALNVISNGLPLKTAVYNVRNLLCRAVEAHCTEKKVLALHSSLYERAGALSSRNRDDVKNALRIFMNDWLSGKNDQNVLENLRALQDEVSALEVQERILEIAEHLPEEMALELKNASHLSITKLNEGVELEVVLFELSNLYETARLYGFCTLAAELAQECGDDFLSFRVEEEINIYRSSPDKHEDVLANLKFIVGRCLKILGRFPAWLESKPAETTQASGSYAVFPVEENQETLLVAV